ncbi:MAG: NAD-dependent epimerase/dehydratase family protein [Oscillospiraceae bacterium]|nr:NAD-dependent epimerase/dehydratase family protein [Oscillospiraceae bacterium]
MKKRILVTGVNSYIGNAFRSYMEQFPEEAAVEGISVRNDAWKTLDFSGYDCVFDVAGIAHADTGHVSEEVKKQYYAVNCDLTVALAKKAKEAGVRQFVFMSSAIVYGDSAPIGFQRVITRETPPAPADFYGDSKLQAEKGILPLGDEHFKITILRPPMIYGKNSKGNYPVLSKMAQSLPVFPKVENQRSMLYIGNLVEFVRLIIKNEEEGFFFPQNEQYSNTSQLVQMIAEAHGKHVILVGGCTGPLRVLSQATGLVNKAFGSLAYDMSMSEYKENYRKYSLEESIRLTEG